MKFIVNRRIDERKNPKLVSEGVFRNIECRWRIQLYNGVYYYDVSQFDRFEGVFRWVNILHSMDLADVLQERNNDLRRYGENKRKAPTCFDCKYHFMSDCYLECSKHNRINNKVTCGDFVERSV